MSSHTSLRISSRFLRYTDVFLLAVVCADASLWLVRIQYGRGSVAASLFAWYGMAALYAGCRWLAVRPLPYGTAKALDAFCMLSGVTAGAAFVRERIVAAPMPFAAQWYDWLLLVFCLGGCSLFGRRPWRVRSTDPVPHLVNRQGDTGPADGCRPPE